MPEKLRMHSTGTKGAWGELVASVWLLEQGYEVFRNVSPNGDVDLVARRNGIFYPIDVKASLAMAEAGRPLSDAQRAHGVLLLRVSSNGQCRLCDDDLDGEGDNDMHSPAEVEAWHEERRSRRRTIRSI